MTITAGPTGTVFRSRWPDVVIPPMSLPQFLLAAADRGDRPALVDGPTGRVTSYGRFAALVDRVAAGLAAHGLHKGQVVAILAPNCPDWLVRRLWGDGRGRGRHRDQPAVHAGRGRGAARRLGGPIPGHRLCVPVDRSGGDPARGRRDRHRRARRARRWRPRVRRAAHPRRHAAGCHHRPGGRPRTASVLQWHQRGCPKVCSSPIGPAWPTFCSSGPRSATPPRTACSGWPRSSTRSASP